MPEIRSEQIKDETITSSDIKNGTITSNDLETSFLSGLTSTTFGITAGENLTKNDPVGIANEKIWKARNVVIRELAGDGGITFPAANLTFVTCEIIKENTVVVVYIDDNSTRTIKAIVGEVQSDGTVTWTTSLTTIRSTASIIATQPYICVFDSESFSFAVVWVETVSGYDQVRGRSCVYATGAISVGTTTSLTTTTNNKINVKAVGLGSNRLMLSYSAISAGVQGVICRSVLWDGNITLAVSSSYSVVVADTNSNYPYDIAYIGDVTISTVDYFCAVVIYKKNTSVKMRVVCSYGATPTTDVLSQEYDFGTLYKTAAFKCKVINDSPLITKGNFRFLAMIESPDTTAAYSVRGFKVIFEEGRVVGDWEIVGVTDTTEVGTDGIYGLNRNNVALGNGRFIISGNLVVWDFGELFMSEVPSLFNNAAWACTFSNQIQTFDINSGTIRWGAINIPEYLSLITNSVSSGQTGNIYTGKIYSDSGLSLISGATYWVDIETGSLTYIRGPNCLKVGIAINSTTILMK